jgi:hypothetical protein
MSIASRPTETMDSFIIFRRMTKINQERRVPARVSNTMLFGETSL